MATKYWIRGAAGAAALLAAVRVASAGAGGVIYRGMPQSPLGNATVGVDTFGQMVISNIGASGDDGVRSALGSAGGFLAAVDIGQAGNLAAGTLFRIDTIVPAGPAGPQQKLLCMTITESGGGLASFAGDPSLLNPGGLRVDALLDGVVVETVEHTPPFPSVLFSGAYGTSAAGDPLILSNIGDSGGAVAGGQDENSSCWVRVSQLSATTTSLTGGAAVNANEVCVTLTDLPPGTMIPLISAVEMRAATIPQFVVSDEALGIFGHAHRGLGFAVMSAGGSDRLQVSNIGAAGDDGVCVTAAPEAIEFGLTIASDAPAGDSSLLSTARTRINELESKLQSLGLLASAGGGGEIIVDFSDLGAVSYAVEVKLDGAVIATASGLTGPVATTGNTDNPECIIWDIRDSCSHGEAGWDPPIGMTVNGIGSVVADALRVTPEFIAGGPPAHEAIESVSLTGTNLGGFSILGETVAVPPSCPWDCGDGDGQVATVDFLALLAGWGAPGPCDFDGGGVDTIDFLDLLAHWGVCP